MKAIRRIEVAPAVGAYAKAQRGTLRYVALSEAEFRALERDRPALVIVDGDAVLAGWPASGAIDLQYAFPSHGAFAGQFPAMLQRLLSAIGGDEAPIGVCLRLTERSSRPYIEPVLFANAFEQTREWWRMTLAELPEDRGPTDDLAPGFLLRPARPEDAEAIAKLDSLSFAQPWLTPETARTLVAQAPVFRVLEETSAGHAIGFLGLRIEMSDLGYVSDLALHPDYRRRGLGEAMLRWALAWFRSKGLKSAALQVNTDNAPAIALYRKLGFAAGEIGLDYRRPIDEEEVRQVLEKRRAEHVTVRRR
jgi:ribosomal-protein-alanine N-acetyltransferase